MPAADVLGHGAREQGSETRDWTFVRRDGSELPVSLAVSAIRAPGGELAGYLGIGLDITSERTAASELRDAEQRFRSTFDEAPIGMAIVSPEGRFTRVNATLTRITGYAEHDLLTRTFQDITHPDDLEPRPRAARPPRLAARSTRTRWRSAIATRPATTSGFS